MADYWGAQAYRFSGGPNGEGTRYHQPPQTGAEFTAPPGDNNGTTIEDVYQQVMNQHPEDMSALADQWQNAYNLLLSIHRQLLSASNALYNEHWKAAEARDAFMRTGPGQALAYLDDWMEATQNNVSALRGLVHVATQSRTDMERLWTEYQRSIEDAKHAGDWTLFSEGFKQGFTVGIYDGEEGIKAAEAKAVEETRQQFNRRAQELANRVGNQYFEYFGTISNGHGAPFLPMDAVQNFVGPRPPGFGVAAPTAPGRAPAAPRVPAMAPKPPVNHAAPGDPAQLRQRVLDTLPVPPALASPARQVPAPAPVNVVPPAPPPAVPVGRIGSPPVPGMAPAVLGGGAGPAGIPGARPLGGVPGVPGAGGLPAPGAAPAGAGAGPSPMAPPGAPRSGGVRKGVLQGKGVPDHTPAMAPPPGRTLGRQPGRDMPGTGAELQRRVSTTPGDGENAFSPPPSGTAPRVLDNQRPGRRRAGAPDLVAPVGGAHAAPPDSPAAAPPVLGRPGRPAGAPGPDPVRQGRRADESSGGAGGRQRPGSEWLGMEAAHAETSAPVLDAPDAPLTGSGVSRLEEVPAQLQRSGSRVAGQPGAGARTRGAVAPEIAARRATPEPATAAAHEHDEQRQIITDEEAFSVQTPGGGVLAKQPESRAYRAEPPTAIGGT